MIKQRKPSNNIFDDKGILNEMLELRHQGWSYRALASRYNVDHKNIFNHVQQAKIDGPKRRPYSTYAPRGISLKGTERVVHVGSRFDLIINEEVPLRKIEPEDDFGGERINKGHNYDYYLRLQYPHLSKRKIRENLKEDRP